MDENRKDLQRKCMDQMGRDQRRKSMETGAWQRKGTART